MKKIFATILAIVYLSTSMGATVYLHYCMGKLVSWGFLTHESKDCSMCGIVRKAANQNCISAKMGCCKDEHKQLKTGDPQKIVPSQLQDLKLFFQSPAVKQMPAPDFGIPSFAIAYPITNAPPGIGKVPAFLLNRNFRI